MRLLLVRHGVAESPEGTVIGHADPPLSDPGRASIAALLANDPPRPDMLVSSDLRRARESAEILAGHWSVELRVDARLRELDFGEWENRTWSQLERDDGVRLERWMRDWTRECAPGGESFEDLARRTWSWLEEWSARDGLETVVLAHAGSIRAILCRLLGVPLERAFEFGVDYARVTSVDVAGAAPRIVAQYAGWPASKVEGICGCPRCAQRP